MHILDLAQNSIAAGATKLEIDVIAYTSMFRDFDHEKAGELNKSEIPKHLADMLTITIRDNGKGMSAEFVARVKDPFTTTRTVRRVGLGIPMFTEAANACDGDLKVESIPGTGTTITAWFKLSHIDRAPLGDIASTLVSIIAPNPDLYLRYTQRVNDNEFVLDTNEVKAQLDGVPINEPPILSWLSEYVKNGTSELIV
jgi:hypothetical protein